MNLKVNSWIHCTKDYHFGDMNVRNGNNICFSKGKSYIIRETARDYITLIDDQNDLHDFDNEYFYGFFKTGFIFGR